MKQIVLWILTAGYGLLSGFAAFTQFGKQGANQLTAVAMAAGGLVLLLAVLLDCKKKGTAKWACAGRMYPDCRCCDRQWAYDGCASS